MIIDWMASKTQLFLAEQDDEFNVGFDFALSPEIMSLLYAQNAAGRQAENVSATAISQFTLDEHELALT